MMSLFFIAVAAFAADLPAHNATTISPFHCGSQLVAEVRFESPRFNMVALGLSDFELLKTVFVNPGVTAMSGISLTEGRLFQWLAGGVTTINFPLKPHFLMTFGVYDKTTGHMLGVTQLDNELWPSAYATGFMKPEETWIELSYFLTPETWGKGVASEVAAASTQFAIEHLSAHGIFAEAVESNVASLRVLEKLKLRTIGRWVPEGQSQAWIQYGERSDVLRASYNHVDPNRPLK